MRWEQGWEGYLGSRAADVMDWISTRWKNGKQENRVPTESDEDFGLGVQNRRPKITRGNQVGKGRGRDARGKREPAEVLRFRLGWGKSR